MIQINCVEMIDISGGEFSLEDLRYVLEVVIRKAYVNDALLELASLVDGVSEASHVCLQLLLSDLRFLVVVQQDVVLLAQVRYLVFELFPDAGALILQQVLLLEGSLQQSFLFGVHESPGLQHRLLDVFDLDLNFRAKVLDFVLQLLDGAFQLSNLNTSFVDGLVELAFLLLVLPFDVSDVLLELVNLTV